MQIVLYFRKSRKLQKVQLVYNRFSWYPVRLYDIIIQQIVTMPIYGKEALNICHPYMTDILRYT